MFPEEDGYRRAETLNEDVLGTDLWTAARVRTHTPSAVTCQDPAASCTDQCISTGRAVAGRIQTLIQAHKTKASPDLNLNF